MIKNPKFITIRSPKRHRILIDDSPLFLVTTTDSSPLLYVLSSYSFYGCPKIENDHFHLKFIYFMVVHSK